jgi:hypothetical protein
MVSTDREGGGEGGEQGEKKPFLLLHTIILLVYSTTKFYLFDVRNCKMQPPPGRFSKNRMSLCFKEIYSNSLLTCNLSVHTKLNKHLTKFTEFLVNFIVLLN